MVIIVAGKEIGVSNLKAHKLFTAQIKKNLTLRKNFFITFICFNYYTLIYEIYPTYPSSNIAGLWEQAPKLYWGENYSALAGRPNFNVPFKRFASNSILRMYEALSGFGLRPNLTNPLTDNLI